MASKITGEIGEGHGGQKIFTKASGERDENALTTAFTPVDQTLQKLLKCHIEPNLTHYVDEADDVYLKFNYENTHATSALKLFSFWKLIACMTIKENNHTILETTTDSVDEIWRSELVGKPYDEQRFLNYVTNNVDDFNELEEIAAATESTVYHYVSLNAVTNNYFKNYILNNVRRLDVYLQTVNTGLAATSAAFHYVNSTADADISTKIKINNLELCVKAKRYASPSAVPMIGQTTKHVMYGYEEKRYTIDADPITTSLVTINLKNDYTHKKFVDRVYFYSIPALSAFNTTTGMVNAHRYIDYVDVTRRNKAWLRLDNLPEKLIHIAEALKRQGGDPSFFNVTHYHTLPYSFVDFTTADSGSEHFILDGVQNGKEEIKITLGNRLTTSAHVTLVVLMRYKRIITKRVGSNQFIDIDE